MGLISVDEKYLKETLDFHSRSLVGKLLKRIEILENKESIKKVSKELIYESYRDLQELFKAYSKGVSVTYFEFKTQEDKTS